MSTVLITGANKGIGLELLARLARTQPNDTYLLGTRSVQNGEEARSSLQARGINVENVKILQIDVTSQESVDSAAAVIKKEYSGKLSAICNNSGIAAFGDDHVKAKDIMMVNYYGVKRVVETVGPLVQKGGHILNISSGMGTSATFVAPPSLQRALLEPKSIGDVDANVENYLSALDPSNKKSESMRKEYPDPAGFFGPYAMSKAFLNSYTRLIAQEQLKQHGVIVISVCPGYCATELNGNSGPRKAATGAWSLAMGLKTSPEEAGWFFRDGVHIDDAEKPMTFEEMGDEARELEAKLKSQGVILD